MAFKFYAAVANIRDSSDNSDSRYSSDIGDSRDGGRNSSDGRDSTDTCSSDQHGAPVETVET